MNYLLWRIVAAAALVVNSATLVAQLTESGLKGTVTDPAGAAISGASVSIRHEATGASRAAVTGESGTFLMAGVSPGSFTITVTHTGFQPFERAGLMLTTGQTAGIAVKLDLADVRTGIEVNASEAIIPVATEARLGDAFAARQIASLPMPGRDIFLLPKLSAGATVIPGAANSTKLFNSPVITVNGNRYRGNNYVLDGAVNVNPNNTGEPGIVPSLESIEEAQIQTGNFSGEYGRGNGSVVNLRTKSGTNDLHGRLWEYTRNSALNARNFFAASRPPQVFNQFGGNAGGPIVKNRTFFFASYEGTRGVAGQALTYQVETPEFRNYAITSNPRGVAAQLLQRYPAPPPQPGAGGARYAGQIDLATPAGTIPAVGRAAVVLRNYSLFDQYLGRVDHSFNEGLDRITARWIAEKQRDDGNSASAPATLARAVRGMRGPYNGDFGNLNLAYTKVFGRSVNDFRFSFQQIYSGRGNPEAVVPDISITGITMGFGDVFPNRTRLRTYEVRDTVTFDRGRHSLRAGGEMRRIFKGIQIGPATAGAFSFASLAEFAADRPFRQTLTVNPVTGLPTGFPRYFTVYETSGFVQDDWKVTPKLNVNLGLRHDYFGDAQEREGRLSSLIWGPGDNFAERLRNASVGRVTSLYRPQRTNFSPRIGLAFDPFGDGKTSLRAGFSIAYVPHHGQSISGARALPPDAVQGVIQPAAAVGTRILYTIPVQNNPEFGRGLNPQGGVLSRPGEPAIRTTGFVVNPTIKTQYSQNWFFNTQREIAKGWIVEVGYVGTRGVNLERIDDANRFSGDLADGRLDRINRNFDVLLFVTNGVNSSYHAMTVELRRQFSKGFSVQANYRWSKWLDTSSDTSTGQFADNSEPGKGAAVIDCLRCEKGRSMFDIPRRLSGNLVWASPSRKNPLLSGWETSAVLTLQSGRPFSVWNGAPSRIVNGVNLGGDYNLDGGGGAVGGGFYDRPNAPRDSPGSFTRQQYLDGLFSPTIFPAPAFGQPGNLGRNTFRGSPFGTLDLAVARNFNIRSEVRKLQFRIEAFNVTNHVNLYLPNADLSLALRADGTFSPNSLFGKSTQAFDARAVQASIRFLF